MYLKLKNPNIREVYPAIWTACNNGTFNGIAFNDKNTGREYLAIELKTIEDIVSLLALAKVSNEYALAINISDSELTITEEPYTLGE